MMIKTERLFIRELVPEDWNSLQQIAMDFRQSEYAVYDRPLPVEEGEIRALTKQFADSGLFFAVLLQDSSDLIGYICFHNVDGTYDLGCCFHSGHHGKGYALESCAAMMREMERHHRVKGFTAGAALNNTPSCKLLERLGFVLTGTEQLAFHKDEAGNDIVFEGGIFGRGPCSIA